MDKLVIFDLDGTLLNTIEDLSKASNEALKAFGYPQHSVAACKRFVGSGIYKLVARSLPEEKRDPEHILAVKAVFDQYYSTHSQEKTKPYPGILSLLETLQQRGIKCGVVTNKTDDYAKVLIAHYFGERVNRVIGQREGIPTKPDPYSVQEMMAAFKVKREACLYVGDSEVDIETARAAGIYSIGVLWGFRSEEVLLGAGADRIVADTEELLACIQEKLSL